MKFGHWAKHYHCEKSRLPKPHYPAIKIQKTTHIQLLCNYPLDITTIVQLSPLKYGVLISKLPCQKISELKMGLLYGNLYILYIHM
jgi:hypothetical protein